MPVGKNKKQETENGAPVTLAEREEFVQRVKERLFSLPDVRPERIRKASFRVSQGYYDRPAVVAKIAGRILEEMGID